MPSLDWLKFENLTGSKDKNFDNLCRGLVRTHFGQFGNFKALSNQPGVEFHLELTKSCSLGNPPRWYGWQCKYHKRTQSDNLRASSKTNIKESLELTINKISKLTDWVLCTPFTLSKGDQSWYYDLTSKVTLHLWDDDDIENLLSGDGIIFRHTYFGELILSPAELARRHNESIQPIKNRWVPDIHQEIDAERKIRRMLGEAGSWDQLINIGESLLNTVKIITENETNIPPKLLQTTQTFKKSCSAFADTLIDFHRLLAIGDLDIIQQKLTERKVLINHNIRKTPRDFRKWNLSLALEITNTLDDMCVAQRLLDRVEDYIGVNLVALLSDSGDGKTQLAAQLTAPTADRPAGILFHGRDLHKGQNLDALASHFTIHGTPIESFEKLVVSLDATGKRTGKRLPIVIDGLNEAENPRDWKAPLSKVSELLKDYPNILLICTLRTGERKIQNKFGQAQHNTNNRELFAVMSLPDDIRKLETEGFGGDFDNALKKYFKYYKIRSGDAEIPTELLQHPLTLRIFCEVTNPKRVSEVNVDYFPASLSLLFENYIKNACDRILQMTNLAHTYTSDELKLAIFNLGLSLWDGKRREINENDYKKMFTGSSLEWNNWDCNIINLFAQEGIIHRNPSTKPHEFTISPVYDAMGGYIIANSLLQKNIHDLDLKWLDNDKIIELFTGNDSHYLAYNIFISLVSLCPRQLNGVQLWKKIRLPLKNTAIRYSTEIEQQNIDNDTIDAFKRFIQNNPIERKKIFSRLSATRSAVNHPFNSNFLNDLLKEMPVSIRDLSWTEWIRSTQVKRINDIIATEKRWKNNLENRTKSDRLRAKWFVWLLTSTNRQLRDIATRALYWYGRGDSEMLFEMSINSLNVNDPYVPERMVAASYGVAMACHTDIDNDLFVKKILPHYVKNIYNLMFKEGAKCCTTHIHMRDYASKTIQLAAFYNTDLFSEEEVKNCNPQYQHGNNIIWGEKQTSKMEFYHTDSPFRMDFENYTIGRLVPKRNNYDYNNKDYQKIRSQILWRIEQLGWTKEKFSSIDRIISNSQNLPRSVSDANKIDRYGKKYSWIAYFEMTGILQDTGVLNNWNERSSSIDIDPSFPEPVNLHGLINFDILGESIDDTNEWILNGPVPQIESFYKIDIIQKESGPWIALDGYLSQEDLNRDRKLFCFTRSFLINKKDKEAIVNHLYKQNIGGRWLTEIPEDYYLFGGEIPWCDNYRENGLSELSFLIDKIPIKVKQKQYEYFLDDKSLGKSSGDLGISFFKRISDNNQTLLKYSEEELDRIKVKESFVEIDDYKLEYKKYNVIIPVREFSWEGYQTFASIPGRSISLAKEIASFLKLNSHPQTFDLYTKDGIKATINLSNRNYELKNNESWFFIREDLLNNYLIKHELTLIWAVWGEREYSHKHFEKFNDISEPLEKSYKGFSFIKELDLIN